VSKKKAQPSSDLVKRGHALATELLRNPKHPFTAEQLGRLAGLSHQRVSVALVALEVTRRATRRYDAELHRDVWLGMRTDHSSTASSALRTTYSIAEAARVTRRTEKALRRRIERGTLSVFRVGRFVYTTHADLQVAGLIDNRPKMTVTARRILALTEELRASGRRSSGREYVGEASLPDVGFRRTDLLVVMGVWQAVGLVERTGDTAWRWVEAH
jgi:hypothetical protein